MKAMIFAAGLGTRLKPLTDKLPKALIPVGGRPLVDHVLSKLQSCTDQMSGTPLFDGYVINVHHFADKIQTYLAGREDIDISDESDCLLETGGGVLHAEEYLKGCDRFLIHNVDILSNLDIEWFVSQVRDNALATLLVSDRKTSRYLLFDPLTMKLKGWTDIRTGEVRSPYPDLDPASCRSLAFSGIHVMSEKVFDLMRVYVSQSVSSFGEPRFPIMDFYLACCAVYDIYGVPVEGLELIDVGKLDTLEQAESFCQFKGI